MVKSTHEIAIMQGLYQASQAVSRLPRRSRPLFEKLDKYIALAIAAVPADTFVAWLGTPVIDTTKTKGKTTK